jgi:hypothetical protein
MRRCQTQTQPTPQSQPANSDAADPRQSDYSRARMNAAMSVSSDDEMECPMPS